MRPDLLAAKSKIRAYSPIVSSLACTALPQKAVVAAL